MAGTYHPLSFRTSEVWISAENSHYSCAGGGTLVRKDSPGLINWFLRDIMTKLSSKVIARLKTAKKPLKHIYRTPLE